ncbi:MAG: heavy metal-binding domain-containing protein [Fimbriimonas sp.]|nr:heavy metal-binding domain-containing protein [Fimbriimonas sp.]
MPYTQGSFEGLPEAARQRLTEMRGTDGKRGLFTSDLSVNEFLLCQEANFDPVGLVMGSSIYHIGFQMQKMFQSQELQVLTQAMYEARELAMTRMEEEADVLGADGIVGVRLEVNRYAWGAEMAEFMAIGTAIKHRGGGKYRTVDNRPFTSDLSGQDFWTLLKAGYQPLSLVMGACVYHVAQQGMLQSMKTVGKNVEMPNFTQALYDARELALSRMQAEAERVGAAGIVGAQVQEKSHGWDSHVIEYFAVGTAVKPIEGAPPVAEPTMTLSLND